MYIYAFESIRGELYPVINQAFFLVLVKFGIGMLTRKFYIGQKCMRSNSLKFNWGKFFQQWHSTCVRRQ
jgi:hypothetical protein